MKKLHTWPLLTFTLLLSACGSDSGNKVDGNVKPIVDNSFTLLANFTQSNLCGVTSPASQVELVVYDQSWQKQTVIKPDNKGILTAKFDENTINAALVKQQQIDGKTQFNISIFNQLPVSDYGSIVLKNSTFDGCECKSQPLQVNIPLDFFTVNTDNNLSVLLYAGLESIKYTDSGINGLLTSTSDVNICRVVGGDWPELPVFVVGKSAEQKVGVMAKNIDFSREDSGHWFAQADLVAREITINDLNSVSARIKKLSHYDGNEKIYQRTPSISHSVVSFDQHYSDDSIKHVLSSNNITYFDASVNYDGSSSYYNQQSNANIQNILDVDMPERQLVHYYKNLVKYVVDKDLPDVAYDISQSEFNQLSSTLYLADDNNRAIVKYYGDFSGIMPFNTVIADYSPNLIETEPFLFEVRALTITEPLPYQSNWHVFFHDALDEVTYQAKFGDTYKPHTYWSNY